MLPRMFGKKVGIVAMVLALVLPVSQANAKTIEIVGTGDGVKVLNALGAAFAKSHPGMSISVPESIGSNGGIAAVSKDEKVVARVARTLKGDEKVYGLTYLPFAKVPVVFFVNPTLDVKKLTSAQVCAIYAGKIVNWKEVGGPDAAIVVVTREAKDSSLGVLQKSLPGFKEVVVTGKALLVEKTPLMFNMVEEQPNAIGFGPSDVAINSRVREVAIDGRLSIFPDYPCINTLAFVFKEKSRSGDLRAFLAYATSPAAAPVIRAAGGMPITTP